MTQEEKQLLLKELCARLPYKIRMYCSTVKQSHVLQCMFIDVMDGHCDIMDDVGLTYAIEDIKPYLRPMSSMTEEEAKEFNNLKPKYEFTDYCSDKYRCALNLETHDWLNAHHFDYRGLIGKDLALEAPEDMYNI